MFGKRLLSIVSALFLGSQLVSIVKAGPCTITYTIGTSPAPDTCEVQDCAKGYYVLTGASEEATTPFTIDGTGSYNRYVKVTGASECAGIAVAANTAGQFGSATTFSVDGTHDLTLNDGKNYLFTDAGQVFTADPASIVVLKSTETSITVDESVDGADYCIDKNGNIYARKDGLCKADIDASAEDCTAYYNCEKGVCTVSNANVKPTKKQEGGNPPCIPAADAKCDKGYYLVKAGGLIKDTATDDAVLWYCPGGDNCIDKSGLIGYFKNAVDTSIFIRCTADGKCVGVKPTGTSCVETAEEDGDVTTDTLYNDGAKLCIYDGGDNSFTLTEGYFFVSIKASLLGLKAADAHFIAVNVDDAGNLTVLKETVRYRYTLEGETKIHLRADAKGEKAEGQICNADVTPYEYILDQWTASETIDSDKADYYVTETYYKAQQQA